MQILDGKLVSGHIKDELKQKIQSLTDRRPPHLAAILVGDSGPSLSYISSKIKSCEEIGFKSTLTTLPTTITETHLIRHIESFNNDPEVDGILMQLPLPAHISEDRILNSIHPDKDVDGFHPLNAGRLMQGSPKFIPATPYGIMLLLEHYKIETAGKHAIVIGRSNIVGRPISILLSQQSTQGNCTVTVCHSRSINLKEICRQADIIIAAIGKPLFVKSDMVKPGAIIIDVGINRLEDSSKKSGYRLVGDVDFESVAPSCSFITPVPGGVGPMTIAALMMNTFKACEYSFNNSK